MYQFGSTAPIQAFIRLIFLFLTFAVPLAAGTDKVDFSIVGGIQFTVPGNWPVIASKSGPEKAVFAFQIPNPADEGTPDSTNLSIVSSHLKDAKDREDFERKSLESKEHSEEKKLGDNWRCRTFSALQKSTEYVIWDCYRVIADCGVYVRIAWPHLPKNSPDYDKQMESVLSDFLASIAPSKKP